jgi:hypothetical protein
MVAQAVGVAADGVGDVTTLTLVRAVGRSCAAVCASVFTLGGSSRIRMLSRNN